MLTDRLASPPESPCICWRTLASRWRMIEAVSSMRRAARPGASLLAKLSVVWRVGGVRHGAWGVGRVTNVCVERGREASP